MHSALDTQHLGSAFTCGYNAGELEGRAALDRLVGRLEAAAALPLQLRVDVVRRPEPNAVALPGGRIYVNQGLIDQAQTPDELAGAIAHEMEPCCRSRRHPRGAADRRPFVSVRHDAWRFRRWRRGGHRRADGAEIVLFAPRRGAADAYCGALMQKAGGDPHALGAILARIVVDKDHGVAILRDHPETKDRIAAINAVAGTGPTAPLLDVAEWSALKQICAPLPPRDATGGRTK
ncbi:MAG: M48 family metalloprotease [Xanthobacteraceae bacterium]